MEYWSVGLKSGNGSDFTLLTLIIRDLIIVRIFPLYQPFINPLLHNSNTPIL